MEVVVVAAILILTIIIIVVLLNLKRKVLEDAYLEFAVKSVGVEKKD